MEFSLNSILGNENSNLEQPKLEQPAMETNISKEFNLEDVLKINTTPSYSSVVGEHQLTSKYDLGVLPGTDITKYRASQQPWYEQAGAFANQAVIGEIVGGTLMSVGALADPITDLFKTSDDDFHNAIYDIGNNISKWSQETTPIYQTGERFNDSGWWFQNGVSVASSLSMLLPGMAAARGAKFLTGLTKLGTTAAGLVETGVGALAMRHAENFREASGVFDEIYNKGIEKGLPEDEAKRIASESASTDYNLNYLNTAFDFVQLAAILRPLKGLTRNVGRLPYALAKAEGKLPTTKLGRAGYWLTESGKALPEQFSEGLEEVVNQISQYESEREGNIKLGVQQDDGSTWQKRVGEYLGRPETVDSFIWGTLGGVAFNQGAKALGFDETSKVINRKLNEVASREKTVQRYAEVAEAIFNKGQLKDDEGNVIRDFANLTPDDQANLLNEVGRNTSFNLGINAAVAGNVDLLLEQIEDRKFQKTLVDSGIASEESIGGKIQDIKKEILRAEDLYKKHYTKFFESPIKQSVKDRLINESVNNDFKIQSNLEKLQELNGEYNSLYSKDAIVQTKLDDINLNPTIQKEALAVAQADLMLELNEAKEDNNTIAIQDIEKSLESLRKKESKLVVDKPISIKGIDDRLIDNLAYQEILKEHNQRLTEKLVKADSKENIQRVSEEEVAFEAEQKRVLEENRKLQEEKVKQDRIKKATETKWNKIIDNAAPNELDKILDQIDKEGVATPEQKADFTVRINRKRESLKVTPEEKVTEVKPETPFGEVVTPTPEDIERRRQVELDSKTPIKTEDIVVDGGDDFDFTLTFRVQTFKDGSTIIRHIRSGDTLADGKSKRLNSYPTFKDFNDFFAEDLTNSKGIISTKLIKDDFTDEDSLKTKTSIEKAINAKYDAELASLQKETHFGEVTAPTVAEITKSIEELEAESEVITKDVKDPNHIDDKKASSILNSTNDINEDLKDSNGGFTTNQSGEIIYENSKISNGFNTLAHQDRAYERTVKGKVVTYTDISDELNESTYKPLLNPNKFKEGTEVELRVDDSDDIEIYDPRAEGKKVTTWGAFKVGLDSNSKGYIDNVPIRMYVDGKPVNVFYHTTSWMNEENIAGSVDQDVENTSRIRQEIVKLGIYRTKVIQTSNGVLFLTKDNRQIKLQEAIGEDDIQIGTVTGDGSIKFDSGKFAEGLLNQEKLKDKNRHGATVIVVPVKNGTLAIPVNRQKIGTNDYSDKVKQSILSAIDIYIEQDNDAKLPILKETGLDITTPEGLERYLNMFINTYNTNKQFLNDAIKGLPKGTNDRYFSIHKGEIEFFDGTLTGRVLSVSNRNSKFRDNFINALEKGLSNFYLNTSLEALNSNRSVVFINSDRTISEPISYRTFLLNTTTTNIKGFKVDEVNGKPVYSYTIQPVVRLDFSSIVNEETISTAKEITEEVKPSEPTEPSISSFLQSLDSVPDEDFLPSTTTSIKEGVNDIFEQNPELSSIGTQQQYSQYLDTIFPDSKVKDIVYHLGSVGKNKKFDKSFIGSGEGTLASGKGFYFGDSVGNIMSGVGIYTDYFYEYPEDEILKALDKDEILTTAVLNIKNPVKHLNDKINTTDAIVSSGEFVVFEPEQIHILGSNEDIEGFKNFVQEENLLPSTKPTIEESTSKYIIKGLGVTKQEQVTNHIARVITKEKVQNPSKDINTIRTEVLERYRNQFESASKEIEEKYPDDPRWSLRNDRLLKPLISNWSTIQYIVNTKIKKINNLVGEVNDELDMDLQEENDNEKNNWDKNSYEEGIKASVEVKRLLADIDTTTKNILGEQDVMDWQVVYQTLQQWTAGYDADFELLVSKINEYSKAYPWVNSLVNKLNSADEKLRNRFVADMTNHYTKHIMNMWSKDLTKKEDNFRCNIQLVNENSIVNQILENWVNNLQSSPIVSVNEDREYYISDEERTKLLTEYDEFKDGKNPQLVKDWLEKLGVKVTDGLWKTMIEGNYVVYKDPLQFSDLIRNNQFIVDVLYKNIKSRGESSLLANPLIEGNTAAEYFAKQDSRFSENVYANSHRAGNKTIYSFGKNKFLTNWIRDLKTTDLAKVQQRCPFQSSSYWNTKLAEGDATFVRNFDYATVSIEALRKHNTKPKEGKELHNLIPAEYEGYEIIGLQASIKDITGGNARVIFTLYLTTSDKSTPMLIQHVAAPISMDINGNLNDSSISFLYEQLVLPEIRRIKQFEDLVSKGVNINNKELQSGGHQFYFLPILNAMDGMWNEDGTINVNVESPEFVERIKGTIREYVDSAVNSKLEKWEQYGITVNGKPEHLAFNVLKEKKVLDGVAKENYVRAAATDMVFQYLVSNANCFTTIIGDPALFFKSKVIEKKANDSGIAKGNYIKNRYLRSLPFDERVELAVKEGEAIFINVGKRLAMDIAPATEGNGRRSNTYRQVFAADRAIDSLELDKYIALLGKEKAESNYGAKGTLKEGTNAQEFTTLKEDLYVRNTYGELPSGFYNAVAEIIDREVANKNYYYTQAILDGLTPEFKDYFEHMVLQVTKPRYGWNEPDNTLGMMMRTYIKTSAYPLTPELTANLEMDKIRVMMEKNGIDRLAFSSGIKVGNLAKPLEIWDKDGNIREDITPEEVEGATKSLSRLGFGIQQDVPYDELKDAINRVSQADKNLFLNIKDVKGFIFNGKPYKGEELEKEYLKHYQELYTLGREKLHRRLNVVKDSNGNVVSLDREALKIAIREEAEQRGYPITDIQTLDLDKALDTIAFMPSADKYESLLNSLVKNSILKMKFKGKSFVLSTEEGFQTKKTKGISEEEAKKKGIKGIVHTDNWKGTLDPGHFEDENGNRLTGEQLREAWGKGTKVIVKRPAQVFIPWKFRDNKGNIVDITKFVKDGKLDSSKLPTELLQMFGMRIPNQGLNSQSWIEVVGFLPHSAGDIVVASRDYLAQMGSDFDVDKLYMYMYNTYFDGKKFEKISFDSKEDIEKLEENVLANMIFETDEVEARKLDKKARFLENVNDVWSKSLQNKLLDIHIAIHANPDETVQKQIYEPLGMGVFKDAADEIASSRKIDKYWTPLSDEYQREKRLNAASGKSLTGDFSNGSMFNAVAQKKDLYIRRFVDGSWERAPIKFGKNISKTGSLSEVRTLDGKYYISDVISWLQSCAVDNEKEQVLDKLNLTSKTSKYAKLLAQLGFVEEVAYFTAQPIVVEYFNLLRSKTSSLSGYNANAQEETIEELEKKYAVPDSEKYSKEYSRGLGLDWKSMRECILNPESVTDFNYIQLAALEQLQYLDKFATDLQTLQSSINTDSKGLDKNLLGTLAKELSIDRITGKRQNAPLSIGNAINVLGRIENDELVPETIQGFATVYGLFENNKLWNNLFPYSSQGVNYVFNRIEQILGKEEVGAEGRTVLRRDIWKAYKSYLFTLKETGLYSGNIDSDRDRLFIDKYEDNKLVKPSLATITNTIKNSQQFKSNPFIQRLNPSIQKNGQPSIIKMNASLDQAGELAVVSAVADLYVNDRPIEGTDYTTRSYFEDLVRAAYLSGGIQEAVQYVRFIPPSYLYSTNFASTLQSIVTENKFEDSQFMQVPSSESDYWVLPSFIIQYVQNNTDRIPQLKRKIGSSKGFESQIKGKVESNDIKGGSIKIVKFSLTDDSLYVTRKGKQVPPEFLTIHDTKRLKSLSKNILFRHTGEFSNDGYPIYHRIDNLGTFAFEEYNANLPIDSVQTSIIEQYNANHKVTNKLVTSPRKQGNYSEKIPNPLRASNISEVLEVKSGNIGTIRSILEDISYLSDDKFYTLVADTILDNFDKMDVGTKFSTNLEGSRGKYYDNTIFININDKLNTSIDGFAQGMLHETLHAVLNKYIYNYDAGKLTGKVKVAVERIINLQKEYEKLVSGEEYSRFREEIKKDNLDISQADLSKFYGAVNPREFITMVMTDKEFQRILNDIPYQTSGESFFGKFLELLNKFFDAIGFEVKDNSMLKAAISDIVTIIESKESIESSNMQGPSELPTTREQLEPAPELPKKLSKYEFTEEEDKLYSSKLHSYTQNIPLKGNELLYKHYNLLNEKGEIKILSNSETVKKWMKFNTVKTKYMFKITQRSSDGLYRPLILEKPNLFSQQLSFKERYNSITDDEVKRNLTKCRGK